jgi:hypothetical protein
MSTTRRIAIDARGPIPGRRLRALVLVVVNAIERAGRV